jgi:glycosyltransferase involved in cell wall biosynthesis
MRLDIGTSLERGHNLYARAALSSIALIGTYVPRRCGIATFTADLTGALSTALDGTAVGVVALNDDTRGYAYPAEVTFEINQNRLRDYHLAADYLNMNRVDVVCVQHEYGIFGGSEGSHVLELLPQLHMPIVTTMHTIVKEPSLSQRELTCELATLSDRVVVMSDTGKRFLTEAYGVAAERITVIPHGIPDVPFVDPNYYKDQFGLEGKKAILTFGLLSPDKGIENMISALPKIAERHPDTVYVVLGATHPQVIKVHGESYRLRLQQLARELNIDDRVVFHDRYVNLTELCEFLGAADVYVTPYLNEQQIVSGTLAYAMSAGKAVVSTPYWYASEMLAGGRGRIVPFESPDELAQTIIELLDDEVKRHVMRKAAYTYCRGSIWAQVARRYLEVFTEVRQSRQLSPRLTFEALTARSRILPDINLGHLERLTDETGILQHATYFVPNRAHGYCTDDNARALVAVSLAHAHVPDTALVDRLAIRYLAFLLHAFNPAVGRFRNFMGYDHQWTEVEGAPDSHGRAIWALGVTAAEFEDERLQAIAAILLHNALPSTESLSDLRGVSFALLGLNAYLRRFGGDSAIKRVRHLLAGKLTEAFRKGATSDEWPWPEDALTYANARLPHALLVSGHALARQDVLQMGLKSLRWLVGAQTIDGHFVPIGNDGWYPRGGPRARFDQQPIEADATVAACTYAFHITGDRAWIDDVMQCFQWFLGRNDVGVSLYDDGTGGCRDGLQATGANDNQGAESTLAWLNALIQMHVLQAAGTTGWTGPETAVPRAGEGLRPDRGTS